MRSPTLEPGRWTGTLSWCCVRNATATAPAIEHRLDAIYEVTLKADTIAVFGRFTEPHTGEGLAFQLNDVKMRNDTLTFWTLNGDSGRVDCTLTRRGDGAFEGPCGPDKEDNVRMLMLPPKKVP